MALSTAVMPNNIGIVPMMLTKHRNFTSPKFRTKTKLMIHSTATPGAAAKNFYNAWNTTSTVVSTEFVLDDKQIIQLLPVGLNGKNCLHSNHCGVGTTGLSCNGTHIATEVCEPTEAQLIPIEYVSQKKGSTGRSYTVKRIQMELKVTGFYTGDITGKFDDATDAAVRAYQKKNGLTVDGIVGPNMATFMRKRNGSYMKYDVEAATPFFNGAYNNAVRLFATLCHYVGAKPSEIICHQEGYRQGVASNHSDVEHWFPLHGKSMDDFRSDVQKYMNGTYIELGEAPISNDDKEYLAAVSTLVDSKIINTPDYWTKLIDKSVSVNNNYVMALLRQAGAYFCNNSYLCACDCLVDCGIMTQPQRDALTGTNDIFTSEFIIEVIGRATAIMNPERLNRYEDCIETLVKMGIINTPGYWLPITKDTEMHQGNAKALLRKIAAYFCAESYTHGIAAIKNAIGMNSEGYWRAGSYNSTNVKCLFRAIAKVL